MTTRPLFDQKRVTTHIQRTLEILGQGDMDSAPYDTAWVARLAAIYPNRGFEQAITWLRNNQRADGSWGGSIVHYHDRVISTLSAITALRAVGHRQDTERISRGEAFLWRESGRLHFDADDTIAFPVLAVSLSNEAVKLGLDIPRDLYHDVATVERKLNMLGSDPKYWRFHTISFSLEAARAFLPEKPVFLESNGSVNASPSATAAVLLNPSVSEEKDRALNYLVKLMQKQTDGGVSDADPIDIFEIAWGLNHFRQANAISPNDPTVRRLLEKLWKAWNPERGVGFTTFSPITDLDCTATAFGVLHWGGYPVNADVFRQFEEIDHFRCFEEEANTSMSAHIRMLAALRLVSDHPSYEGWKDKIIAVLRRYDLDGRLWFDKWHASAYYLASLLIPSLHGLADDLTRPRLKWLLQTQREDGGWGYYDETTLEETAYGLQTLLYWDQHVERVDRSQIDAAAQFLIQRTRQAVLTPLWIGKCLYTPRQVVRSAIWAALYNYRYNIY